MSSIDHDRVAAIRAQRPGVSWAEVAASIDHDPSRIHTLASAHQQWLQRQAARGVTPDLDVADEGESHTRTFSADEISRITCLEDLLTFFKVDTELWDVSGFRVNKWEQHSDKKGITPLYQIRANLVQNRDRALAAARLAMAQLAEDMQAHTPDYAPLEPASFAGGDPCLVSLHIYDPHIGMKAWGSETGGPNQDLKIAIKNYDAAAEHLISMAMLYPVEEVLLVIGHDMMHADMTGMNATGGTTAKGTALEMDTRLEKMFTETRRAAVRMIDKARASLRRPITVRCVQGNHDPGQVYRLGEVLSAWYRDVPDVTVDYGPRKMRFHGYGKNALMLTHGEEYKRHRDNLPLIFSQECPPEMWVRSTHREVLTGHWHKSMGGAYLPTSDLDETRGVRVRSLPGLTAPDGWHANAGFKHSRAATLLVYKKSGGLAGLHEFNL